MKRELPFLSFISIGFSILVLAGLGFSVWLSGGKAFNPGGLTDATLPGAEPQEFSSHASFEQECERCHQPFSSSQTDLCLRCHTRIADQRETRAGTHGRIDPAMMCADCHPEHKGRNFDPVAFAVEHFDHSQTSLPLTGAHASLECAACHVGGNYRIDEPGCAGCHAEPDLHAGMFSQNCAECHTDLYWQPAMIAGVEFDHSATRFSLARHMPATLGGTFSCGDCHTTGIAAADQSICISCHRQLDQSFMAGHLEIMGMDCLQCHDGTDKMAGFNHDMVFILDGKHAELACSDCHAGFQFADTPADCSACHAEPEIHAGAFGTTCADCHSTTAWQPALLTQHPFPLDHGESGIQSCQTCHPDGYPEYTCYACHEHQPDRIVAEHREEGISGTELDNCASCHPTGREHEGEGESGDDDD